MRTVAIIQARMGSTRLPGKVMRTLCGDTVLAHVVSRVKACSLVDEIVIATTVSTSDDVIATEAEKRNVRFYRGSEENVLERYYLAAKQYSADIVIRVTSDCPLLDPSILSSMLEEFVSKQSAVVSIDYLSNSLVRTYPRGLDVEIFTFTALERAYLEATQHHEKEHVTPYIYQHPEIFTVQDYIGGVVLSSYRWTLDTEEDFRLIDEVYSALYSEGRIFKMDEIMALMEERPELKGINAHIEQKQFQASNVEWERTMSEFKTEQEQFWAGEFGDNYTNRNQGATWVGSNTALFAKIISDLKSIKSVIEFEKRDYFTGIS